MLVAAVAAVGLGVDLLLGEAGLPVQILAEGLVRDGLARGLALVVAVVQLLGEPEGQVHGGLLELGLAVVPEVDDAEGQGKEEVEGARQVRRLQLEREVAEQREGGEDEGDQGSAEGRVPHVPARLQ